MDLDYRAWKSACPDRDTLAAFSRGRLPDEPLEIVAEHVSSCAHCATILEELQAKDTVVFRLRRPSADRPVVDEAVCAKLAEQARAILEAEPVPATVSGDSPTVEIQGPPLPAVFGRYLLLERLGQGGMGIVYKARHEVLELLVAIKMIRAGTYASTEERRRFQREGKAIARIRHAHVVQIHDFGEQEGQLYLSMELLEGGTLTDRLCNGPLPEREAAELVLALTHAVAAAHEQEVVHRDLKPGNVLFTADGTVKITDFGLAKVLDAATSETVSDAILGTPTYMSPEQASGEGRKIGPATDVYALGVILYEALTGSPPLKAESRMRTLDLVRTREPEQPSRRRPGLSRDLEAICLKCLEKTPEQRYPSATALAEDLDNWLRGEPTKVRPPGWRIRFWHRLRRRPRLAFAAALFLFAVVALGAGLWYRDPERPIQNIESELARGRAQTLIGETGGPRWSRWRAGEATSQMSVLSDGTFSLNSWQSALLELVPDPQRSHYRFRALVRHQKGAFQSEIGIYFAHHPHVHPAGIMQQFAALTFYDIESNVDNWAKNKARLPNFTQPRPLGNPAMLDPHLYAERAPEPWTTSMHVGRRAWFEPTLAGNKEWRELAVEVTPAGIWGFWGDKPMGIFTSTQLVDRSIECLFKLQTTHPEDPFGRGVFPVYAPRGGLGLYVYNGAAAFRRVVIEPLDDLE
ncbi:MAG TPA: protein kinase [Gemmataceae bacterium]|nr:protein kinase [Gemmataceae bacterium]